MQQQNQMFYIEDKTTGIALYKSHIRCITTWQICAKEESRRCWDESTNQIVTAMIRVREIINEVDATDGNTAPIEGQGLNVRSQQRNKKCAG